MSTINIHPADELAAVRDEIRQLEAREAVLRNHFLEEGLTREDFEGEAHRVAVLTSSRETLDKAAVIAEFGLPAIQRFIKKSTVRTVKVGEKG